MAGSPTREHLGDMHRVHFDTGRGALCGTMAVIGWTTKAADVTCGVCRARLARLRSGEIRLALTSGHPRVSDASGELAASA